MPESTLRNVLFAIELCRTSMSRLYLLLRSGRKWSCVIRLVVQCMCEPAHRCSDPDWLIHLRHTIEQADVIHQTEAGEGHTHTDTDTLGVTWETAGCQVAHRATTPIQQRDCQCQQNKFFVKNRREHLDDLPFRILL